MNQTCSRLLLIACIALAIAALIFIFIAVFGTVKSKWFLPAGLVSGLLSNLFNLIRSMFSQKTS